MSDEDSDIEFYSFIQVNEDLSNSEDQSTQLQNQSQKQQHQQVQKEVTLSTSNTNEDQFFKKLSFAFYSTNSNGNSQTNLKESASSRPSHNYNQSAKITFTDNQSTQPHTPKYIVQLKSEEYPDAKSHHLLKNYQIKKIQKHPIQIDMASYEDFIKRKQVAQQKQNNSEQTMQSSQQFLKKQNGNTPNVVRCSINLAQQKQIMVKKNLKNNFAQAEQFSYDQPQNEHQENKNGIENKQFNSTVSGFYTQGDQAKRIVHPKIQKEGEPIPVHSLNGRGFQQKGQQESLSKQNLEYENIETIILNNSQDGMDKNDLKQKIKKPRYQLPVNEEKKYDFINHFMTNKGSQMHNQQQPLSSRQPINTINTEAEYNKKIFTIENSLQKKFEEAETLAQVKPQQIPRRSTLQYNKEQAQQTINNMTQSFKNNDNGEGQFLENNSTLSNNFFKISSSTKIQQENAKEEKILFSGRKIKQDTNANANNFVSNFNVQNINEGSNSNLGMTQSIKSPIVNRFTPQLRKNGTINLKEKGFTTPRQSLQSTNPGSQPTTGNQQTNLAQSAINMNSNNLLFQSVPFSAREEYANSYKSELITSKKNYNILQKPQFQMTSSTKKFGQNQIQLANSIDSNLKQNKTIKEQQLLLSSNMSPSNFNNNMTNSIKSTNNLQASNIANQPYLNRDETSNNDYKNSFLSQAFKQRAQFSGNKYLMKNELVRMPLTNSQKLIDNLQPFTSIQNSNNQSQKLIPSPKVASSTAISASKQKFFISQQPKKVESIYTCDFEEEQSYTRKITMQ